VKNFSSGWIKVILIVKFAVMFTQGSHLNTTKNSVTFPWHSRQVSRNSNWHRASRQSLINLFIRTPVVFAWHQFSKGLQQSLLPLSMTFSQSVSSADETKCSVSSYMNGAIGSVVWYCFKSRSQTDATKAKIFAGANLSKYSHSAFKFSHVTVSGNFLF